MDYIKLKPLLIGTLFITGFLFLLFVFIVRRLRREFESRKIVEPDDIFYQNLKTALEKQHALNLEVKRREEFQKTILDSIPVGVLVLDKYKKVRDLNQFFKKFFNISDNYIGHAFVKLNLPSPFSNFIKEINFSMLLKPFEKRILFNGKVLLVKASKVTYFQGEEGILVVFQDITELEDAKRKLELKNRLEYIGEMSANIAHEFKNSISTVKGYGQMILQQLEGNNRAKRYAEKILKESENINEVVNRFLLYAKPLSLNIEEIDAFSFFEELKMGFFKFDFVKFNLATDFRFKGDTLLLRQCFSNLIKNAIESVSGVDNPEVQVFFEKGEDKGFTFRVKDNGSGIDESDMTKIFIPFFTTRSEGTGLGLSLCEKILTLHNGTIEVKSEKGRGTEVIVRI